MSGNYSRNKGLRFEREVVNALQDHGIAAERIPLSGSAGGSFSGDISCPVLGYDRRLECKIKSGGYTSIYSDLGDNFGLVIRQDRAEPLVVLRLEDFARLIASSSAMRFFR